ncbi:hypothetical protein MASR2M74_11700 [Paracoccaceae bacterium]
MDRWRSIGRSAIARNRRKADSILMVWAAKPPGKRGRKRRVWRKIHMRYPAGERPVLPTGIEPVVHPGSIPGD